MKLKAIVFAVVFSAVTSDVVAQSWSTIAPMAGARYRHASVTGPDGKVYVIGGLQSLQCLATMERYDPLTNVWTPMPSMSVARCDPGAVVGADGLIYVVGGETGLPSTDAVERFDTSTLTWETLAPLNTPRGRPAVAVGSDLRIYALGGHNQPSSTDVGSIEVFDGQQWTLIGQSAPGARIGMTGVDGDIYTFGVGAGAQWGRFDGSVWTPQGAVAPPSNGDFAGAAGPDGLLYLLGVGTSSTLTGSSGAASQDLNGVSVAIPNMLRSRGSSGAVTAAEGQILITGGSTKGLPGHLSGGEAYGPLPAPIFGGATALFRFDEPNGPNVVDSFGGNTGIAIGAPLRFGGRVGKAIRFSGSSQYVRVNDAAGIRFGSGDMTIEGWIRWLPVGNLNRVTTLIDKRTYAGGKYQGYSVYFYKGRLGVQLANGQTYVNYGATKFIPANRWMHIAVTVDRAANLLTVYVNGVVDKTWVPLPGSTDNPAPLFIGRHSLSPQFYRGFVDELTFYERALRWAEVRAIFLAGREGKL